MAFAQRRSRRGAAIIEGMLIVSILLMMLFFILDLGIAACRYNALCAAARSVARQAVVHGASAPPERTSWGPAAYVGTANSATEMAQTAAPLLTMMRLEDVNIQITWLDAGNEEDDRVQVRLQFAHQPMVPFLGLTDVFNLQATCVMRIAH